MRGSDWRRRSYLVTKLELYQTVTQPYSKTIVVDPLLRQNYFKFYILQFMQVL